jgi:hypothetical protein
MELDRLIRDAMEALNGGDPDRAREKLRAALEIDDRRPDLLHALGALELQRGAPGEARPLVERALGLLDSGALPDAEAMRPHFQLSLATIAEAQDRPDEAELAYRQVLRTDPAHGDALAGLGRLQLALGQTDAGLATLQAALAGLEARGAEEAGGLRAFIDAVGAFRARHPRAFLEAHRDRYCAFFDHHARQMAEKGWIAEAARMRRSDDGGIGPDIPEGARPYAATRIDLVDPATGQGGMVGDRPMLVALDGLEPLARSGVLFPWPGLPFELYVSSQCPWDHLPVQVQFVEGDAFERFDPVLGAWYTAGFEGRFGTEQSGRFHFVSPPERHASGAVVYVLDLGRATLEAVDDLVDRLEALHAEQPLSRVILGRGQLPVGQD